MYFQEVEGYTIPAGHQVCVSPTTNHRLTEVWEDVEKFNPDRLVFIDRFIAQLFISFSDVQLPKRIVKNLL